jgi:hypothetical protein
MLNNLGRHWHRNRRSGFEDYQEIVFKSAWSGICPRMAGYSENYAQNFATLALVFA